MASSVLLIGRNEVKERKSNHLIILEVGPNPQKQKVIIVTIFGRMDSLQAKQNVDQWYF